MVVSRPLATDGKPAEERGQPHSFYLDPQWVGRKQEHSLPKASKQTNSQAEAVLAPRGKVCREAVLRPELGAIPTSHLSAMTVNTHPISEALQTLAITSDRF